MARRIQKPIRRGRRKQQSLKMHPEIQRHIRMVAKQFKCSENWVREYAIACFFELEDLLEDYR